MKENEFWTWFDGNQTQYRGLDVVDDHQREVLLDKLLVKLHEYCDQIYFQIGSDPSTDEMALIITAEGKIEYFEAVERLVNAAPKMPKWKVIAFKQASEIDFITEYEGIKLDPRKMWFLPLDNKLKPKLIGIRLCIENYNPRESNQYKLAAYQVLDAVLGEKVATKELDFFDIDDLQKYEPGKEGLIELVELPRFITWKKQQI